MIPELAGVHHLKLPVSDLGRSRAWYESRLGYVTYLEFKEGGALMGIAMRHPEGGPDLGLRLAPEKAAAAAGFDYFSIGVPDRERIERLAEHLTELGEVHAGVHGDAIGWILPLLHDPDGHEVRFYTMDSHRELPDEGEVIVINAPGESAEAAEEATTESTNG
jgi:catechol 2,3-dioxygenase-like lactoylglutathione lyase family enzyme